MVRYQSTQKELDALKESIMSGKKLNDFGDYECGCSINPKYKLIGKLCAKHQGSIKEA